jgi:transcriptional regulator with XRE-family HTH domain
MNLRERRKLVGKTLKELARELETSPNRLSAVERGYSQLSKHEQRETEKILGPCIDWQVGNDD